MNLVVGIDEVLKFSWENVSENHHFFNLLFKSGTIKVVLPRIYLIYVSQVGPLAFYMLLDSRLDLMHVPDVV